MENQDPVQELREQIASWERRKEEAHREIAYAEAILPALHDGLRRLEALTVPETAGEAEATAATTPPPPAPVNLGSEAETPGHPGSPLVSLRGMEEITSAVEEVLPGLPQRFVQSDVDGKLTAKGREANRSSLRTVLLVMAQVGRDIKVLELGKGRRATVFEKL